MNTEQIRIYDMCGASLNFAAFRKCLVDLITIRRVSPEFVRLSPQTLDFLRHEETAEKGFRLLSKDSALFHKHTILWKTDEYLPPNEMFVELRDGEPFLVKNFTIH